MTYNSLKATIDAALVGTPLGLDLMYDIAAHIEDPSVVWPEMPQYGAPVISREQMPSYNPATTAAADTAAVAAMLADLRDRGGTGLFRRRYGIASEQVLEGTRESVKDGIRLVGTGNPYNCGLVLTGNNYNGLLVKGNDPASGRRPFHPTLHNFGVTGGTNSGKGIVVQGGGATHTDVSNGSFSRLYLLTGEEGLHVTKGFQLTAHLIKAGSYKRHAMSLQGGNATKIDNCYWMRAGDGYAGLRVIASAPVGVYASTGLDENVCSWAAIGSMANVAGTTRAGGSASIVRLGAAHTEGNGFFDMCQLKVTSGAQDGAEVRISRYVKNDPTHGGPTAYLSEHTPLAAVLATGVTYNISDGDSQFSQAGQPYAKDARITFMDCNVETWARTGIKSYRSALATLQNLLFFQPGDPVPNYDCLVYWNEHITNYSVEMIACRMDVSSASRNAGYPADLIQGKGTRPMMMGNRLEAGLRNIYSMETGTSLRMKHEDPFEITLPTGFPTTNPGAGKLWIDGTTLRVGT